ncbi:MAG: hypothetical protein GY703_21340 [Gammaproteobacteria bacterium]|nr:hypothetical protein [Gammaproteobacteria bacterium]
MNVKLESDLFHPIEHALLADYFGVVPPKCAKGIDPYAEAELQREGDKSGVVRIRLPFWGSVNSFTVKNAVARLALNSIQDRLPQWGKGSTWQGRDYNDRRKLGISLLPQYLFEINWADSWPEKYFVTFVPGHERYVVTASADCPDTYGYEDIAIGHYSKEASLVDGCRQVLVNWWKKWTGGDPERRWQDFWGTGLIDHATARRWSVAVWGPSDDDFMMADIALGFWEQNVSFRQGCVTADSLGRLSGLEGMSGAWPGKVGDVWGGPVSKSRNGFPGYDLNQAGIALGPVGFPRR